MKSLLNASFKYVPAAATDIKETWRKFGWKPTNELPYVRGQNSGFGNQKRTISTGDAKKEGVRPMRK